MNEEILKRLAAAAAELRAARILAESEPTQHPDLLAAIGMAEEKTMRGVGIWQTVDHDSRRTF